MDKEKVGRIEEWDLNVTFSGSRGCLALSAASKYKTVPDVQEDNQGADGFVDDSEAG